MDDPFPFPLPPDEPIAGLCSKCGLLSDLKALNKHLSSMVSARVSAAVDKFLSNNYPIPSETREEIVSFLEPNTALLEKVDEAVIQLSDLLESLKATQDALADQIQRSRSVLHPLRILPDECLSNILSHCITHLEGQDDKLFRDTSPLILEAEPWALAGISRRWRDIALNTPNIWSNIMIIDTAANRKYWEPSRLSALNLLLTRSATHPLDVIIINPYGFSMTDPLLQGVMAHCQRWRRLHLAIPIDKFTFLEQIYHNVPLIEHLFITYSVIDRSVFWQDVVRSVTEWNNFDLATNLRSICMSPKIIYDTFKYCPRFANRIKKYRSVFRNPDDLPAPPYPLTPCMHLRALRKLPNLEDWTALCLFDGQWPSVEDDVQFEEEGGLVVMGALRCIRIKEPEDYWSAIAQVLDHMSAPSLSELTLEGNMDEACVSSVIDFIERSGCKHGINTVILIDTGHNRGATPLVPLLSKLVSVVKLGLQYTSLPPPPLDDEVDLLSLAEQVLPKGLEILVVSNEMGLDETILDGVRDAMPRLKVRKVDKLEVT
jgi:hypothetical protein